MRILEHLVEKQIYETAVSLALVSMDISGLMAYPQFLYKLMSLRRTEAKKHLQRRTSSNLIYPLAIIGYVNVLQNHCHERATYLQGEIERDASLPCAAMLRARPELKISSQHFHHHRSSLSSPNGQPLPTAGQYD